jgi:hypothetical protein
MVRGLVETVSGDTLEESCEGSVRRVLGDLWRGGARALFETVLGGPLEGSFRAR